MFELGWLGLITTLMIFNLVCLLQNINLVSQTVKREFKAIMRYLMSVILSSAVPMSFPIVPFFFVLVKRSNSEIWIQIDI